MTQEITEKKYKSKSNKFVAFCYRLSLHFYNFGFYLLLIFFSKTTKGMKLNYLLEGVIGLYGLYVVIEVKMRKAHIHIENEFIQSVFDNHILHIIAFPIGIFIFIKTTIDMIINIKTDYNYYGLIDWLVDRKKKENDDTRNN